MRTSRLLTLPSVLGVVLVSSDCQQSETSKQNPRPAPVKLEASAAPNSERFDSPRAVYKRYAEMLNASRWAEAIAVFSPAGKAELVLANFKGLAVLAGTKHPKQEAYAAVLHEFCQAHRLRCAADSWNALFTPTLLREGDVSSLMSDLAGLAAAKPEATYVEVMTLLQGVDASSVVPLDPTLSNVMYLQSSATGVARRADGQTSTMSFESSAERGWMIAQ